MLKKSGKKATYFGTFKLAAAVTAWKSTSSSILEKTAHGLETGNIIYIKAMSEGGSGLVKAGEFFYVKKVTTGTIELSQTESSRTGNVVGRNQRHSRIPAPRRDDGNPEKSRMGSRRQKGEAQIERKIRMRHRRRQSRRRRRLLD